MKTFEEWCQDREIVLNELSPKFLTMAYKIWGEDCFVEGQRHEAENAALRERLEKLRERIDKAVEVLGKLKEEIEPRVYPSFFGFVVQVRTLQEHKEIYGTEEAALARLAELKGGGV